MADQRRLRFSDISGLDRTDLPIACEIWLEDIYRAPWITREAMKLSAYFMRYMVRPELTALSLREIESQCQFGTEEVRKALVLMKNFGAVEGFLIERNDIRVGLCLTYLQRLRALDAKAKFSAYLGLPMDGTSWPWSSGEDKWVPVTAAAVPEPIQPATNANGDSAKLPPEQTRNALQAAASLARVVQHLS